MTLPGDSTMLWVTSTNAPLARHVAGGERRDAHAAAVDEGLALELIRQEADIVDPAAAHVEHRVRPDPHCRGRRRLRQAAAIHEAGQADLAGGCIERAVDGGDAVQRDA